MPAPISRHVAERPLQQPLPLQAEAGSFDLGQLPVVGHREESPSKTHGRLLIEWSIDRSHAPQLAERGKCPIFWPESGE